MLLYLHPNGKKKSPFGDHYFHTQDLDLTDMLIYTISVLIFMSNYLFILNLFEQKDDYKNINYLD